MKKRSLIICVVILSILCSKTALKAAAAEVAPWQTYLEKAPVQAEQFAADPLGTLLRLFAAEPVQLLRDALQQYAAILLFLSLAAGLAFLLQDTADKALLELAAAGGCGVLLWQELDKLAAALCTRMAGWKSYLLGFLPVYSGVLAAGGEWNAGAAANGFLLTVLCFIAQAVTLWLQPLLRSYLAISMACGISSRKSLSEGCTLTGRLLRQAIGWAGKAFAALMSIQRVVTVQLDRSSLPSGTAADRQCAHRGAGAEQRGRRSAGRDAAAQKHPWHCCIAQYRGRVCALVSRAAGASVFSVLLQLACRDRWAGALP